MFRNLPVAIALTFLALPAAAQVASTTSSGVRQHDGFFLQLQAGPSYMDLGYTADDYDVDIGISGVGFGASVAIGGTPLKNFVVFGEILTQSAVSPEIERDGEEVDYDTSVSLSFANIGPGVAYYFGESNIFVSGSVGIAVATLEEEGFSDSVNGVGVRVGAGKEWWVGNQWGIGFAANVFYASLSGDRLSDMNAMSFALNFTATYH